MHSRACLDGNGSGLNLEGPGIHILEIIRHRMRTLLPAELRFFWLYPPQCPLNPSFPLKNNLRIKSAFTFIVYWFYEKADKTAKKSSSNWYVQIKNPTYRSETNYKEIYIRQMAEIMGQSDLKKTPWNTRSYRRVANRPQKYQKRSNTCQIVYWAHPHYSFAPVKREGCPIVPNMQSTTYNQTYPSKL